MIEATPGSGLALAFAAGAPSVGSPRVLPLLPSFLAHLTGVSADESAAT